MSKRVLIRADAGPSIGGGHVCRTSVLGAHLQSRGYKVFYATRAESREAVPSLLSQGFEIVDVDPLAPPEEPDFLAEKIGSVDLFVLDHYQRGIEFEQAVRPFSNTLLVLDDLPTRPHDCDVLLDQTLGRSENEYSGLVPAGCRVMTGPSYALLREQFAEARRAGKCRKRREVSRLLIMVGAGDASGILSWVLEALSSLDVALEIEVVSNCTALSERHGKTLGSSRLSVHRYVSDMATLIANADLAIGAAGSASWERCCLGLPALLFILADNQRDVCAALHKSKAAINLGRFPGVTRDHFLSELLKLLNSEKLLSTLSENAALLCDGRGAERLLEHLSDENRPF